jgi:hypothetical protein
MFGRASLVTRPSSMGACSLSTSKTLGDISGRVVSRLLCLGFVTRGGEDGGVVMVTGSTESDDACSGVALRPEELKGLKKASIEPPRFALGVSRCGS